MMWEKEEKRAEWLVRLMEKMQPEEPVATANGTFMEFNAVTIGDAPGSVLHPRNTSFYEIERNYNTNICVPP